jgi:hypothetical protein
MSTDTPTLRDELAMRAPITFDQARDLWQHESPGTGPDLRNGTERRAFMAFWWTLRLEWADVGLAAREEPAHEPGEAFEDRRLDRQLITLNWFDYRVTKPLAAAGVNTLRQLLALDVYKLDAIKGIGPDGLRDILDRLNREGLRLAPKANVPPHQASGSDEVGAEELGA